MDNNYNLEGLNDKSGIYSITNTINGKIYIGLTSNIQKRWMQHHSDLKCNRHRNSHLQNSYNKHGNVFKFSVVEFLPIDDEKLLIERESYWINFYDSTKKGYNNVDYDESYKVKSSEETRKKLSESKKGTQTGSKNPFYGKTHTEETKKILSEKATGRKVSDETRKKLSEAFSGEKSWLFGRRLYGKDNPNYDNVLTTEMRENISRSLCGGRKIIIQFPDGKIEEVGNFRGFCRDHNLDYGAMKHVRSGKYPHHKKFKVLGTTYKDVNERNV